MLEIFAASESAFNEFERLKGSYEQEVLCRDKAEKYAATVSMLLLTGAVIHTNYRNVLMVMFV